MIDSTRRLAGALALILASAAVAAAEGSDPGDCETLRTINATGNKIWVTVYDLGKLRHLDYGWVDACSIRTWRAGSYACGSFYHVRAEVKPYDVNQANVFDTSIQTNPQGGNYTSQAVTLRRTGTSNNYYWQHGNTAGCTPTGMNKCCGNDYQEPQGSPVKYAPPPPRAPDRVAFTFDNTTPAHVLVTLYTEYVPKVHEECVDPKTVKNWSVSGAFEYRVRVAVHRKGCDDGTVVATHVGKTGVANAQAGIKFLYDAQTRRFGFPH